MAEPSHTKTDIDKRMVILRYIERAAKGSGLEIVPLYSMLLENPDGVIRYIDKDHIRKLSELATNFKGDSLVVQMAFSSLYSIIKNSPKHIKYIPDEYIDKVIEYVLSPDPHKNPFALDNREHSSNIKSHLYASMLTYIANYAPDRFTEQHIDKLIDHALNGSQLACIILKRILAKAPDRVASTLSNRIPELIRYATDGMEPARNLLRSILGNPKTFEKFSKHHHDILAALAGRYPAPKPVYDPIFPERIEVKQSAQKPLQSTQTTTPIPDSILQPLKDLGISITTPHDLHSIRDKFKNHRDDAVKELKEKRPELDESKINKAIDSLLPELESYLRELSTKRLITSFYLKRTPKDAYKWLKARIKASDDCTVPKGPAFLWHTVPTYFASNAANYEIHADHYDARSNGRGLRLRKNRHVGNVYVSLYRKPDGEKILYIHGVQIANPYRGKENTWIAEPLLKAFNDMAKERGIHEIWIQTRDLSNHIALQNALITAFKKMGAEPVSPEDFLNLDYVELPRDHYASPHLIGPDRLLKMGVWRRKREK